MKAFSRIVALGASVIEVLPENPRRRYCLIVNDDAANPAYLSLGDSDIAVGRGIRLNTNGGSYEINLNNLWTGRIYGIAAAAVNVTVTEW